LSLLEAFFKKVWALNSKMATLCPRHVLSGKALGH